jgi:flagellar biosynthesis protein FliQ
VAKNDDVRASNDKNDFGEIVDLVKTYAKQETVGPLRSAGRYLAYGLSGAFLMALGLILLLIGLLRVLQTETDVFDDGWSFVPYFIVVVVGAAIAALFVSRIPKDTLDA